MKTISKYFLIIYLLVASGCYQSGGEKINFNQSITDGYRLIDYANRLITLRNYRNAVNNYLLAYNRFALSDYIDGRYDSASKLVFAYNYLGVKDSSNYWLSKSEQISEFSNNLKEKHTLTKIKFYYEQNEYDKVLSYLSNLRIEQFAQGIKIELLSYKILSATMKLVDVSESYNSLYESLTKTFSTEKQTSYEVLSFGWYTLGYYDFYNKNSEDAMVKFQTSLKIDKGNGNSEGIADNLFMLGKCSESNNKITDAIQYYERALEIYKVLNSSEFVSELNNKISKLRER
jgi:hypothetical protein